MLRRSLVFVLVACTSAAPRRTDDGCASTPEAHVAVHSRDHELLLCANGHRVRRFGVRLARNGTGKRSEGDGKLPFGRYSLGNAVPSQRFGLFLPIGYPTASQRAIGMTGSAVGVHGPAREAKWLGRLVNTFDTTDGCVGLATDDEMRDIASFVRTRRVTMIVLD